MSQRKIEAVELNGIQRNFAPDSPAVGVCEELINLHKHNGALRPVPKKKLIEDLYREIEGVQVKGTVKLFKHSVLNPDYWIKVDQFNSTVKISDLQDGGYSELILNLDSSDIMHREIVLDGAELNNWFVLTTNKRHIYLLWDGTQYVRDNIIPGIPAFTISGDDLGAQNYIAGGLQFTRSNSTTGTTREADGKVILDNISVDDAINFYNSYRSLEKRNNHIPDDLMVRLAIELKDGSYLFQSAPLFAGRNNTGIIHTFGSYSSGGYVGNIKVSIEDRSSDDLYILFDSTEVAAINAYKDLIKGVIFAVTKMTSAFDSEYAYSKLTKLGTETFDSTVFTKYKFSPEELGNKTDAIIEDGNFFIVKRWELDELPTVTKELIKIDWSGISSNEILLLDDTRYRDTISYGDVMTFNKRIHLANYRRTLAAPDNTLVDISGSAVNEYWYEVKIKENNELFAVIEKIGEGDTFGISKYLFSYPHAGAYQINIYEKEISSGDVSLLYSMDMKAHPNLNYAYAIKFDEDTNAFAFPALLDTAVPGGLPSDNRMVTFDKQIAVSNYINPSIFEARHSYSFGDGNVIGMGVPTFALTSGQFGDFPLFVFTSKGIWALIQGSGDILYSSQIPVSNDVANGRESITGTKAGIIYATTDGLKVIAGENPVLLSDVLNNKPFRLLADEKNYQLFAGKQHADDTGSLYLQFPELYDYLCTDSFYTYLQGAILGYYNTETTSEVLISNKNYPYSFVFDIEQRLFYKITQSFSSFINDYPKLYALDNNDGLFNIQESEAGTSTDVFFETPPIQMGSAEYKHFYRSIMRGYFYLDETKKTTLAMYISNDTQKWMLVNVEQPSWNPLVDIYLNEPSNSAKYCKFVFSGKLDEESHINGIHVTYDILRGKRLV